MGIEYACFRRAGGIPILARFLLLKRRWGSGARDWISEVLAALGASFGSGSGEVGKAGDGLVFAAEGVEAIDVVVAEELAVVHGEVGVEGVRLPKTVR